MITKRIHVLTPYLQVQQSLPYVDTSNFSNNKNVGNMNYLNGNVQVSNGNGWTDVSTDAYLDLSPKLINMLDWVDKQMARETAIKASAQQNPAVANIKKQIDDLNSQLDMTIALCKE